MADPFTIDQILHMAELASIAGGAITVAYKIGTFTQAVENANKTFIKEMEESKQDRAGIHDEIKRLAEAMGRDQVFTLQIANLERAVGEVREWYDDLRRGKGKIG